MYITRANGYYRGTEQCVQRGWFLLLLQRNIYKEVDLSQVAGEPMLKQMLDIQATCAERNTYACVRRVALRQLGHFMMGHANLCGKWVSVSGSYGSDGLPMSVDRLPADAVPLPHELYTAWKNGGGWNGAGSEAPAMRDWALQQFKLKGTREECRGSASMS